PPEAQATIMNIGLTPTPEVLTQWFEAVMAVQRTSAASPEFYEQTARAMVNLVWLDSGLVLLRRGDAWNVQARAFRDDGPGGREFSYNVLNKVVSDRRTFYQPKVSLSQTESLHNVSSVVASPIFDAHDNVIGALYGARKQQLRGR